MEQTDHHLLVGKGAQEFARSMGFKIEDDLNTEKSRGSGSSGSAGPIRCTTSIPKERAGGATTSVAMDMIAEGLIDRDHYYGTINCDGVNAEGRGLRRDDDERPGVEDPGPRSATRRFSAPGSTSTATSARPGSTGRGEANLYNLSLVPDRRGDAPRRAPEGRRHRRR